MWRGWKQRRSSAPEPYAFSSHRCQKTSDSGAQAGHKTIAPPSSGSTGMTVPGGRSPVRALPLAEPPELESMLAAARAQLEQACVAADYFWALGDPAEAVAAVARERQAELDVLGAHHGRFFSKLLGADVAADSSARVGCPVLVVD